MDADGSLDLERLAIHEITLETSSASALRQINKWPGFCNPLIQNERRGYSQRLLGDLASYHCFSNIRSLITFLRYLKSQGSGSELGWRLYDGDITVEACIEFNNPELRTTIH